MSATPQPDHEAAKRDAERVVEWRSATEGSPDLGNLARAYLALSRRVEEAEAELGECAAILGALNAWISLGMHKAMATGGPTQELMLKDIQARLAAIHAIEAAAGISEASQNE